jgi:hypothetical protein
MNLQLDVSIGGGGFDQLGSTYRDEGLSIGADHMVLFLFIFNISRHSIILFIFIFS